MVNVDTYYDTCLNKSKNMGDLITHAIDLEILVDLWLKSECYDDYEFLNQDDKQKIRFNSLDDYTRFCLRWC